MTDDLRVSDSFDIVFPIFQSPLGTSGYAYPRTQSVKIGIETERDSLRHLVTLIGSSTLSARKHHGSVEDDRKRRWPISESRIRPLCGHKGGKNARGRRNDQESLRGKKREPGMVEVGD